MPGCRFIRDYLYSGAKMQKEVLIEPIRDKKDPLLPVTGILIINPTETIKGIKTAQDLGGRQYRIFNAQLMHVASDSDRKPFFVTGPAVGAPMAVMTLEKLIAIGAREIIVFGWCGTLTPELKIGDILIPTWGVSEEGTSQHYPLFEQPESSKKSRGKIRKILQKNNMNVIEGPIWTTDAPYRETIDKVIGYKNQGVLGVDMEFTALCTVAAFRNISICAVSLVSDALWSGHWQKGFNTREFKKRSSQVMNVLFDYCQFAGKIA